jgi:PAS domain S-box-containing protein
MSDTGAAAARQRLAIDYERALADCVAGAGEVALTRAYELGRMALVEGVGLLELSAIHHQALSALARGAPGQGLPLELAAQFFAESLSPIEMTLRAHRESTRLLGLNESLTQGDVEIDRAREQLRTMLDATTAIIYLKDVQGRYLFVNRQFLCVFGLARAQVIGRTDEQILPPAVAQLYRENDARVMAAAQPEELEETLPEPDGAHTYIALKFPLLELSGVAYALCCVATDITERKRADDALRRAKRAAEEANSELESFSYSVAHDLRAPLRSIDGFSRALLEDYEDVLPEDGKKYLRYVYEAAQRMAQLIDDLLLLSRVTRGELERKPVDLTLLARQTLERLAGAAPERRVELVLPATALVQGDERLLAIALDNLLGNAWKFTSKHELPRIELGQQLQNGQVITFVRDNGAGFDMARAHKLFGVFQRLHRAEEFEGTGIGLATVQRVIRRHGGDVWATAAPGLGATFFFTLAEDALVTPPATASQRPPQSNKD